MEAQNVVKEESKISADSIAGNDFNKKQDINDKKEEKDKSNIENIKEKKKKNLTLNKILLIVLFLVIIAAVGIQVFIYFHKQEIQNYIVR